MPRQGRINIEGGIYHVIQRGIERRDIFKDDADRIEFLRRLAEGLKETGHKCYGWVLMPNHFHLLVRAGTKPLSDLMRGLLTGYAIYFNRKYQRSGYLYQNRYKSILCQEESYLLELVRYIHLNPLRAKLVKDMCELNNYRWSGHSVLAGKNNAKWQSTGEILKRFGKRETFAVKKYIEFVTDAKEMGKRKELTGGGLIRSAGGWSELLLLKKLKEYRQSDERMLGDDEFVSAVLKESEEKMIKKERLKKEGWDIEKMVLELCRKFDIKREDIFNRGRMNSASNARKLLCYFGNKELGLSGTDIARYLKVTKVAVSKAIRYGERIAKESNYKLIS